MKFTTKLRLLAHLARWLATRNRFDTNYRFTVPGNPKFMGPRDAAKLIRDGDVVAVSGLGGNQWVSIMYRSIRTLFQETGHPRNLTVAAVGGQGARGRSPGSLEELGLDGLCTRLITAHVDSFKSLLRLAKAGKTELQCIPQGVMAHLIENQGHGEDSLLTDVGVGTFIDPRVGPGTPIAGTGSDQWVQVEGDKLRFRPPKINVAIFNAPAADRDGNIYLKDAALQAEICEIAKAARKNGGVVIANVARVVEPGYAKVLLPGVEVDAVVVYPGTEQAASVKHLRHWPLFTTESDVSIDEGVARLKFINQVTGITPRRSEVDNALARLAASVFAQHIRKGSLVNIGVGLPEEVCRCICEAGLFEQLTFFTESGVYGGLPAPGVFFGAAVCPQKIMSSAEIFHLCRDTLDVSILGMLQFDTEGNVNVSKRGEGPTHYVGPGGFIDFSTAAKTVIFISSWMVRGKMRLNGGKLDIVEPGKIKFTEHVDEITFSGKRALQSGRDIFYVTNVGAFKLAARGLELILVAPGIDIRKDILEPTGNRIVLPESGSVPVADSAVMTGNGFRLQLRT